MSRLGLFLLLFVAAEMAALIWLGRTIGVWPAILVVLGTGVLGAWLARRQAALASWRAGRRMAQGVLPAKEMTDGLIIAVAAVLLIIPGVLTDVLGLALLFPPTRALLRHAVLGRFTRGATLGRMGFGREHPPRPRGDQIIDARVIDARVVDDSPSQDGRG